MKFLLDHDVPVEAVHLLRYWAHDVSLLKEVLPVRATDDQIFEFAQLHQHIIISCNRAHFLALAKRAIGQAKPFSGLIVLKRRHSRQAECAHLLRLLRQAGETGLAANINFA